MRSKQFHRTKTKPPPDNFVDLVNVNINFDLEDIDSVADDGNRVKMINLCDNNDADGTMVPTMPTTKAVTRIMMLTPMMTSITTLITQFPWLLLLHYQYSVIARHEFENVVLHISHSSPCIVAMASLLVENNCSFGYTVRCKRNNNLVFSSNSELTLLVENLNFTIRQVKVRSLIQHSHSHSYSHSKT